MAYGGTVVSAQEGAQAPEIGTLARDVERNRVGVVMARRNGHVRLRPRNGGREWVVPADGVEPLAENAPLADRLRAKLAEVNRRSKGEQ
jgi:hypothetical protein